MSLALELTEIHKRFGPVVANAGASIRVASGTVHAVVGENGAGKSTLLSLITGQHPPDTEKVLIEPPGLPPVLCEQLVDGKRGFHGDRGRLPVSLSISSTAYGRRANQTPLRGWR